MKGILRSRRWLLVAPAALWVAAGGDSARAQEAEESSPMRVTSDSEEYCETLWHQLRTQLRARQHSPATEQARDLAREGWRMCGEGHLRPGILRLRRALQLIRDEDRQADGPAPKEKP